MTEIVRYTGNLQAPAVNAAANKRGTYGDPTGPASDTLDDNLNADLLTGWEMVGPSEQPTIQDFNSMGFTLGQIHAYLHQVGVPEWDSLQEYYAGKSITNVGGVLYRCLIDDVGTNPVGDLTGVWIEGVDTRTTVLASSGYKVFPDGLIIQWGIGVATGSLASNAASTIGISWPIVFPTGYLGGTMSNNSAAINTVITTPTASGATQSNRNVSNTSAAGTPAYIVIGH